MTTEEAMAFIAPAIVDRSGTWADIGAGSGTFTYALQGLLEDGKVYAVDKNPHVLWKEFGANESSVAVPVKILEGDFNHSIDLPPLDGILMANALHYARDPLSVLRRLTMGLKSGGSFLLIEYETEEPRPPWVPFPVSFGRFTELCSHTALSDPQQINSVQSQYGYSHLYLAVARRLA